MDADVSRMSDAGTRDLHTCTTSTSKSSQKKTYLVVSAFRPLSNRLMTRIADMGYAATHGTSKAPKDAEPDCDRAIEPLRRPSTRTSEQANARELDGESYQELERAIKQASEPTA